MKKNKKLLIGLTIAVVALIAVLVVVLIIPSANNEIKVEDNNAILIYDKNELSPEEISIRNEGGYYQLLGFDYEQPEVSTESSAQSSVQTAASDEESEKDNKVTVYTMQDYSDETLSVDMTNKLLVQCRYMAASKLIDKSGSRYAEYGLAEPRAEAKIVFSDDSSVHLRLGNDAPDNMGVYMLCNDDKNVYLVPANMVDMFFVDKLQMFDKQLTGAIGERVVSSIDIKGTGYEQDISIGLNTNHTTAGSYVMEKPYRAGCDDVKVQTTGNSVFGLNADEVVAVGVEKSGLSEYGLDKPYEEFKAELSDGSVITVIAGKKDSDGYCYLTVPSKTIVYRTKTESLTWYEAGKNDFLSDGVLVPDQNTVDKLVVSEDGKDYTFIFEREYKVSENYTDNIITSVKYNGIPLNIQYAINYINNLSSIMRQDDAPASLDGCTVLFSVKYSYIGDTGIEDQLQIYQTPDKKAVAVLNGKIECYTDMEYIHDLLKMAHVLSLNLEVPDLNTAEE